MADFTDWENYIPPIDYHISRIAIKTGVLVVQDEELLGMLRSRTPVSKEDDFEIRSAAIEAVGEMARHATQSSATDLQGLLWALGLDCCHEDEAHCFSCPTEDCSALKYYPQLRCEGLCPLQSVCRAANDAPALRSIREQNFITTWY